MQYKFLPNINSPSDIKKLNNSQLNTLSQEIRDYIITVVSKNGGHLASNLGTVELTIALHRVFASPKDAIIFDVGHQCYTHKLLTGRFNSFPTLRKEGGISGFLKPSESEHDQFITGHSSNSISAAYGIYKAKQLKGESGTAIAVIGDGALTGGMAYEALNNAGNDKSNFIVVLNDNEMSISKNVGALARTLTKMRNRPKYHHFKSAFSKFLLSIPGFGKKLNKLLFTFKEALKSTVYKQNIFSSIGFNYLGPVDGHNIEALESILKIAQGYQRPTLVHVITTKGKGYSFAETSPNNYHGVSAFDIKQGASLNNNQLTFSDIAGEALCKIAEQNSNICAITAAMTSGTGLAEFSAKFTDRFFDVGIAEQHAVTFGAGLAKEGLKPYFAVYSSFLQRAYDQMIHDVSIGSFNLNFLIDRAGIVGEDGETHQGIFDVSYLTSIPKIEIFSPSSYKELAFQIEYTSKNDGIFAIRYPRGREAEYLNYDINSEFSIIGGNNKKALVTYGRLYSEASKARKINDSFDIVKLNKIYPFSNNLLETLQNYNTIHFFEEGIKNGGIGEHLSALLLEQGYKGDFLIHAIKNEFVPTATTSDALNKLGLDCDGMLKTIGE